MGELWEIYNLPRQKIQEERVKEPLASKFL
jgi:hypothetical protein